MPEQPHLKQIIEGREALTREDARTLMEQILAGNLAEVHIAALLGALAARGETAPEIAGFVDAMRSAATPLPLSDAERSQLVDTCGTGGDASHTFNISTAAALVAAAAGAGTAAAAGMMVAKHGNRAITSQCGSADVLEALGIPVEHTPAEAAAALRRHRFAFLHAPTLHPAMRAVMPVRRALGMRTVFNILGPLANPAGASRQVMGVYSAHLVPIVAEAMALLGTRHAFVVHGHNDAVTGAGTGAGRGLDEISISGPTHIAEVRGGPAVIDPATPSLGGTVTPSPGPIGHEPVSRHEPVSPRPIGTREPGTAGHAAEAHSTVTLSILTPEDAGFTRAPSHTLLGGDARTNAAILRCIFAGERGPRRNIVLLNAAAVLVAADLAPDLPAGVLLAAQAIDSGAVTERIAALARKD